MTDIVDKKTRSKMMSSIQGKDTKPEMMIRKALFAKGIVLPIVQTNFSNN